MHFNLANNPSTIRIPTSALIFRENGVQVAVLGAGNKVELKPVKLGRNLGTEFEVLKGLTVSDTVINSPPDSLSSGDSSSSSRKMRNLRKLAGTRSKIVRHLLHMAFSILTLVRLE